MKEIGTGRTRLGRFAAMTVPATAASLGLGYAIVTGMVSATLSSADGFDVASTKATADNLQLSLSAADAATSVSDDTAKNKEGALVSLKDGHMNTMCLAANQKLPGLAGDIFPNIGLKLTSTSPDVRVNDIDLKASTVDAGQSTLPKTEIGIASSQTGQTVGANEGGFGMRTLGTTDQAVAINNLNAKAYALTLDNGLSLDDLKIAVSLTQASC